MTRPRPLYAAVALAALAGLAPGCSDGGVPRPPEAVAGGDHPASIGFPSGWTPDTPEWSECDIGAGGAECATLEVPLDWDDPDGATIDLALARIPATGERIGPLLTNPGGPGASGVDSVAAVAGGSPSERFDIVSWDPRGVGRSTAISCDGPVSEFLSLDPEPDDPSEQADLDAAADAVARGCADDAADLLEHVSTKDVARDMEAIRLALGGEALNYLGFSYGTHIGQVYAELFGEHVRAMVLDGVVDPALGFEDFLLGQAAAFDDAFAVQHERCVDAGVAACGVEDLAQAFDALAATVENQPITAEGGQVGPAELATAAAYTAYRDSGWDLLGQALADGLRGDGDELANLADHYRSLADYGPYAAVVCTDSPPPTGPVAYREFARRAAEVSPRFGAAIANEMLPCATWGAPSNDDPGPLTAPDAPDILVIGNTGDPATPIGNARSVAETLERGHLVVAETEGHGALGVPCVSRHVRSYLVDLQVPGAGTTC